MNDSPESCRPSSGNFFIASIKKIFASCFKTCSHPSSEDPIKGNFCYTVAEALKPKVSSIKNTMNPMGYPLHAF